MITAVRPKFKNQRQKPSTITLTDFMRIQNEIIPSNAEYENRKEKDRTLKQLSQTKATNWPDSIEMKKKNQFESHKNKFLEQEMIKRKIDEEEQKYQDIQNNLVLERAKKMLFEQQDPVKSFNSKLMYSDMLKEREFQKDITERKRLINQTIEKQFFDMEQKKMEDYDRNELLKAQKELEKRNERMKIVHEQLQESKIRRIQDYQEKMVEGHLMKAAAQKAIEEDKRKEQEKERRKLQQREEFLKANEELEKLKEERRKKELEEEKKIEEFAFKKKQLEELKEKVANEKSKEKQAQRQKLIDKQIEYLNKLRTKEEEILQKSLKEAEEKKQKEEQAKQDRLNQMKKAIEEQREYVRRKKEEKKIQEKKEEAEFVDDWKRKMKQLEEDERQEYLNIKERNKMLAEYQKMQYDEKKKLALKQFEQLNEDSYKTKLKLDQENDEFLKYAENCIRDYHKQGKDITPLLLELKRYKKTATFA